MVFNWERRNCVIRLAKGLSAFGLTLIGAKGWALAKIEQSYQEDVMKLPLPTWEGKVSVEQAIKQRRTIRRYGSRALNADQLSQLLWAAGGITENKGYKRAAPSAGALYPMDLYVVVGEGGVASLKAGIYHYEAGKHGLSPVAQGDMRSLVAQASLSQMWMAKAPLCMVITAEYSRVMGKYGRRGIRYAMIEAGHMGQNIFLQARALGLDAGIVGAFDDNRLIEVMGIPSTHEPLLVMPVGYG